MTIKELLEKRAEAIAEARAIYDKAKEEKRQPTDEESGKFDAIMKKAAEFKAEAEKIEANEKRSQALQQAENELEQSQGRQTTIVTATQSTASKVFDLKKSITGDCRSITLPDETKALKVFNRFLTSGVTSLSADEVQALQKDSDTGGGFLSAPMQFVAELIKAVDDIVFMREICRVMPPLMMADSLGAPSLDNDISDPEWTSELSIGTQDTTMSFGRRELKPNPLAKWAKVSKTLIRRSAMGADAIVRERLAYKMGIAMENGYLNGDGNKSPLGVFTASNLGISTDRDFSTGNTETAITVDGLKEAQYALKAQYRRNASWIFHRDAVKQLAKLKDDNGQYIWQASIQLGQPDRLLNNPVRESEYAPNTFTSGKYVGIIGDFRNYWIVDAMSMTIQVLLELYAATNQNAYLGRLESDGMPVLEEAFARVKLA